MRSTSPSSPRRPSLPKYNLRSLLCPTEFVTEDQLATDHNLLAFDRSIARSLPRRGFMAAFASAAIAGVAFNGTSASAQAAAVPPIVDVLNFALNLEYLEANFYAFASTGSGISAADMGPGALAPVGAPGKLPLDAITLAIAQALAQDERNHVELLRSAITSLGGTPISQPLLNYAAMGAVTTQAQFLTTARQFTALGNSAYVGSAALLASSASVLTTAAQILGAEGQHAGALNYQCIVQGVTSPAIDAQDVPPTTTNDFTVLPPNALSPSRIAVQVLGVAYNVSTASTTTPATGVVSGGFFPNGFNGNIKST